MRARSVSQGRRDFLRRSGVVLSTLLLLALGKTDEGRADAVSPPPACDDGHGPTPRQTAGPFSLPHSPQRASLREPGINGTKIVLTGRVLLRRCRPGARGLCSISGTLMTPGNTTSRGSGCAVTNSPTVRDATAARPLCRFCIRDAHDTLPCDGASAERACPHDPTLLSGRAAQRSRFPV